MLVTRPNLFYRLPSRGCKPGIHWLSLIFSLKQRHRPLGYCAPYSLLDLNFTLAAAVLVVIQEVVQAVEDHAVAAAAHRPVAPGTVASEAGGSDLS